MILICALGLFHYDPAIAGGSVPTSKDPEHIAELIVEYFPKNYRDMQVVANCESTGLVHRNPDGTLIANPTSTARGVFQLLMRIHGPEMKRMGLDPNNDDDYMKYVRHLYNSQGLEPWDETRSCWGPRIA